MLSVCLVMNEQNTDRPKIVQYESSIVNEDMKMKQFK